MEGILVGVVSTVAVEGDASKDVRGLLQLRIRVSRAKDCFFSVTYQLCRVASGTVPVMVVANNPSTREAILVHQITKGVTDVDLLLRGDLASRVAGVAVLRLVLKKNK